MDGLDGLVAGCMLSILLFCLMVPYFWAFLALFGFLHGLEFVFNLFIGGCRRYLSWCIVRKLSASTPSWLEALDYLFLALRCLLMLALASYVACFQVSVCSSPPPSSISTFAPGWLAAFSCFTHLHICNIGAFLVLVGGFPYVFFFALIVFCLDCG